MDGCNTGGIEPRQSLAPTRDKTEDGWLPVSQVASFVYDSRAIGGSREMSDDKRSSARYDLGTHSRIAFDGGRTVVECVIRNLSKTGACIEVPVDVTWPQTFALEIHGGESREVEVVWSENTIIGLRFLEGASSWGVEERASAGLRADLLGSIEVLQEELDRLRRVVETKL